MTVLLLLHIIDRPQYYPMHCAKLARNTIANCSFIGKKRERTPDTPEIPSQGERLPDFNTKLNLLLKKNHASQSIRSKRLYRDKPTRGFRPKTFHSQNGMGLQKIESFLEDIFSCGGCNFDVSTAQDIHNKANAKTGRRYSNSSKHSQHRSIGNHLPLQQYDFYPRKQQPHCHSASKMIACDDDIGENSVLNETGTTHPDSFLLNESLLSISSRSIGYSDRPPLQILEEPPLRLQEPPRKTKPIMVPTERIVGTWPPVVSKTIPPREGQQPNRMQPPNPSLPPLLLSPLIREEQDQQLPQPLIPARPPEIRRLTLDDAPMMRQPDGRAENEFERTRPQHDSCYDEEDGDILPRVPVYRSRSLDFLCATRKWSWRRKRKEDHYNHIYGDPYAHYHVRYYEEENPQTHVLDMLSDLNETYMSLWYPVESCSRYGFIRRCGSYKQQESEAFRRLASPLRVDGPKLVRRRGDNLPLFNHGTFRTNFFVELLHYRIVSHVWKFWNGGE